MNKKHAPVRSLLGVVGLVGVGSLTNCAPLPEDAGEDRGAINGTVNFEHDAQGADTSGCTQAMKDKLLDAMDVAVQQVRTSPAPMRACLQRAFLSGANGAYPELVVRQLAEDMPTTLRCRDLGGASASAPVGVDEERATFDTGFLTTATTARVAAVLLRMVTHNKGYTVHRSGNAAAREYAHTVSEQVEACSASISRGDSPALPNGGARDALTAGTELAPVGGAGGSPFERGCTGGAAPIGIQFSTDAVVRSLALRCPSTGGVVFQLQAGTVSGPLHNLDCRDGYVLTGITGRAGALIDMLGPLCSTEASVRAGRNEEAAFPILLGGNGGFPFSRRCPDGTAVSRVVGRAGASIDRLRLECRPITGVNVARDRSLATAGGVNGDAAHEEVERCAGRRVLVGLDGAEGARVDRLAGLCGELRRQCTSAGCAETRARSGHDHLLVGHGGWGGSALGTAHRCADGEALVGVSFRSDTHLRGFIPHCADVNRWSNTSLAVAPYPLSAVGDTTGAELTERMCERGEFLAGWTIRDASVNGTRVVTSLRPLCRRFESN